MRGDRRGDVGVRSDVFLGGLSYGAYILYQKRGGRPEGFGGKCGMGQCYLCAVVGSPNVSTTLAGVFVYLGKIQVVCDRG